MTTAKTILNLTLALTISAVIGLVHTGAASRVTEDLTELIKYSQAVAEVSVTGQSVQDDNAQNIPFTVVTLKVEKVYKGELNTGAEIRAEYMGGAANGKMVVCPGQAHFKIGDRAVVLLTKVANAANWRVLAGDAGQIILAQDGEGRMLARRATGRFEFYAADAASLTGYRQIKSVSIYASQMDALLNTLVKIGRPVLENEPAAEAISTPAPVAMAALTPASTNDASLLVRIFVVLAMTTLVWAASRRLMNRPQAA